MTVIFADLVQFTPMVEKQSPEETMSMLNELFTQWDRLTLTRGQVYKVETIGDCYMAVSGMFPPCEHHANHALRFAIGMQEAAQRVKVTTATGEQIPIRLRVGMHSGAVTSGLIGMIRARFCLFGDTVRRWDAKRERERAAALASLSLACRARHSGARASTDPAAEPGHPVLSLRCCSTLPLQVNTASRMETNSAAGCVLLSDATFKLLGLPEELFTKRRTPIKGKGEMETYLLEIESEKGQQARALLEAVEAARQRSVELTNLRAESSAGSGGGAGKGGGASASHGLGHGTRRSSVPLERVADGDEAGTALESPGPEFLPSASRAGGAGVLGSLAGREDTWLPPGAGEAGAVVGDAAPVAGKGGVRKRPVRSGAHFCHLPPEIFRCAPHAFAERVMLM